MDTSHFITFFLDNYADAATITCNKSNASADTAVANLKSNFRSDEIWRTANLSAILSSDVVKLTIDLAADPVNLKPVTTVALVDLNLSATGIVRVQAFHVDPATPGAIPVITVESQVFAAAAAFGVGGYGVGGYGGVAPATTVALLKPIALVHLGAEVVARYWVVTLMDDNPSVTYVQASRFYLGSHWQPSTNISVGNTRELQSRVSIVESIGGREYGDARRSRSVMRGELKELSEGDADYLWQKFTEFKDNTPFLFSLRPTGRAEQLYTTLWARFADLGVVQVRYNNYTVQLNIREWL